MPTNSIPISTQWLLDSVSKTERSVINSVCLIICPKTKSKGTGFLIESGDIITNLHVIQSCNSAEIFAILSDGKKLQFQDLIVDENRDLAVLRPTKQIGKGLELIDKDVEIGTQVSTWGYPLGYSGPAPILCVGYMAGFTDYRKDETSEIVKHYIVNAAFNPGNSGGPLFISGDNKIIGVVVAKHAPITKFLLSAIKVLAENPSGIIFEATDEKGNKKQFSESQITAMLLEYFRDMTQVVIGEAISITELIAFLKENSITV